MTIQAVARCRPYACCRRATLLAARPLSCSIAPKDDIWKKVAAGNQESGLPLQQLVVPNLTNAIALCGANAISAHTTDAFACFVGSGEWSETHADIAAPFEANCHICSQP